MTATLTKARSDAWDATLDDAQRWRIYAQFRKAPWYEVVEWIADEYHLEKPSRSALYAWGSRMRSLESAHRIDQAIQARDEIGALAGTAAASDRLIAAYQSIAAELALKGNAADAVRLTTMAMQLAASQTATAELEIKRRNQELREREVVVKEVTSRDMAIDLLLTEAADNEQAQARLKEFVEALGK